MERIAGKAQGLARAVLTPPFRYFWKVTTEGEHHLPPSGGAIIAPNHISVLDSFFVPLVAASPDHLRRQGRVHGRLEDQVPVPGHGHDPDRPIRGRLGPATRSIAAASECSRRASSSASTRRAPAPATAACTRATPASPASPCAPAARSSRSGSSASTGDPAARCQAAQPLPAGAHPLRATRSTSTRYPTGRTTGWCCARSPTR